MRVMTATFVYCAVYCIIHSKTSPADLLVLWVTSQTDIASCMQQQPIRLKHTKSNPPVWCRLHPQWLWRFWHPTPAVVWSWHKGCPPEAHGMCQCRSTVDPSSSTGTAEAQHMMRSPPWTRNMVLRPVSAQTYIRKWNTHKEDIHAVNDENPPFLMLWGEWRGTQHWAKRYNQQKKESKEIVSKEKFSMQRNIITKVGLTVSSFIARAEMLVVCPANWVM